MLQLTHSQLFVVLLYPPAGSGCCRISCRYSLVLRKMPGIVPYRWCRFPISASTILTVSLLNYKLHLKHECQYNTYLILVLRCQERVWPVPVRLLRPMGAFDNAGDRICRLVKIIG